VSGNVHEATLARVTPLASGVVEYVLEVDDAEPLRFRPGQFISLRVGIDEDRNPILRSYSIGSSPGRRELSLIVKLVPGGTASEWLAHAQPGTRVHFTGPMGFFVLDLAHGGDVVFGVTGVGIAPCRPMLEELLARDEPGRVILYWGNRHESDLFWRDEFAAMQQKSPRFSVRRYLTAPPPGWSGDSGRITAGIVDELQRVTRPTFYLVGNGAMIRDVKAELVGRGVDRKRQIRNEAFFD
jgi:ferredoxin-NADP reductase